MQKESASDGQSQMRHDALKGKRAMLAFQPVPLVLPGRELQGPGDTCFNYAEVLADGVHHSAEALTFLYVLVRLQLLLFTTSAQKPAKKQAASM